MGVATLAEAPAGEVTSNRSSASSVGDAVTPTVAPATSGFDDELGAVENRVEHDEFRG